MRTVDKNTGLTRESGFVIIERMANGPVVRGMTLNMRNAEKFVFEMFAVNSAKLRREYYFVASQDNGSGVEFGPESGNKELYNQGSATGVIIEWKWVS